MKVFICWSGERSREFGLILKEWLGHLIGRSISATLSIDIRKGTLWFDELDKALGGASLGIVCLTEEALRSPWIHYEAGILSRALRETGRSDRTGPRRETQAAQRSPQVFPLLFGLGGHQLQGPLAAYQSTLATSRDDMWRFAQAVAVEAALSKARLRKRFDASWNQFLASLESVSPQTILEVFPEIDDLFRGKAFEEPLQEQLTQNWLDRYDEVRRVHLALRSRLAAVQAGCRPFVSDLFSELTAETEAYARDLSLLLGQPPFAIDSRGAVVIPLKGPGRSCERRRTRALDLAAQLVDPRQAAWFDSAFRFASATSTEQRKRLVHREANRLETPLPSRRPSTVERFKWLASDWDLDRILFYEVLRTRPLKAFGLAEAVRQVTVEFEKVRFRSSQSGLSLMALYYSLDGLRRMLESTDRRTAGRTVKAEAALLVSELVPFLDGIGRGRNQPIRTALRDIAGRWDLTLTTDSASGASRRPRTIGARRKRRSLP